MAFQINDGCVMCGACAGACPVGAIAKDEDGHARIDFDKCISCGKCASACPFGAVHEKSQIIDVLKNIKAGKKVIAMIAPNRLSSSTMYNHC